MQITIDNIAELPNVAQALIEYAQEESFFIFEGDMGAGKTTFIKAFCEALGVTEIVSSPTFSIVNEYIGKDCTIYHFDFYRLKSLREAYDIGYEEYFYSGAICLIEWPSKVEELLPEKYIKVEITANENQERLFAFSKIS
jgi:tRNA threonylcarbamoyladenosine biosynthesis protein TsaE